MFGFQLLYYVLKLLLLDWEQHVETQTERVLTAFLHNRTLFAGASSPVVNEGPRDRTVDLTLVDLDL